MALPQQQTAPVDEDHLSPRDFKRISDLIGEEVGIKLPPAKRVMVEGRLRKRARALGLSSLDAYSDFLFNKDGLTTERVHLIDAVTTNKTDFFREPEHFTLLKERLVPALLNLRAAERQPLLKIWSAASSTGAEAYTLAMVLADLVAQHHDFRFSILGTDISTAVLEQANRAVYPTELVAPVPAVMQQRYLLHSRQSDPRRQVRIVPELRRLVRFLRLNLMDSSYPFDRDVDVIFLRNVLIYFDEEIRNKVLDNVLQRLRPGGFLLTGHTETSHARRDGIETIRPSIYRKVAR